MAFRRILLAVDESPIAAHAADLGADLAKRLGAELAFICVVDPGENVAPGSGLSAAELIALAQQDGKRLLAGFRQRAPEGLSPLEFIAVGKPASEIRKGRRGMAGRCHRDGQSRPRRCRARAPRQRGGHSNASRIMLGADHPRPGAMTLRPGMQVTDSGTSAGGPSRSCIVATFFVS